MALDAHIIHHCILHIHRPTEWALHRYKCVHVTWFTVNAVESLASISFSVAPAAHSATTVASLWCGTNVPAFKLDKETHRFFVIHNVRADTMFLIQLNLKLTLDTSGSFSVRSPSMHKYTQIGSQNNRYPPLAKLNVCAGSTRPDVIFVTVMRTCRTKYARSRW